MCEVDIAIDYRALAPIDTRYGPALEIRELGANKVLAIFSRAEPRDFVDLAELVQHYPLDVLIDLAIEKDPGFDLGVFQEFMRRIRVLPREDFDVDDAGYESLLRTVEQWDNAITRLRERRLEHEQQGHRSDPGKEHGIEL